MNSALVVVECNHSVAEQDAGVGERRLMDPLGSALRTELIAEVAGEAADEVEWELWPLGAHRFELLCAVIEDRPFGRCRLAVGVLDL